MKVFYQNRDEEYSARMTVNNTYPSHLHKQAELIYVTKGRIEVTIRDEKEILSQGDLSLCFPNQPHSTKSLGDSSAILIIFNPDFAEHFLKELTKNVPSEPFLTSSQLPLEVKLAIKSLLECYSAHKDYRIAQGYISIILGCLMPFFALKPIQSAPSDAIDVCQQLIDYVSNNFMNDITLDVIAHDLGLNKYYISHIFSERIQESFPQYLGKCRAEHAAKLLRTTTTPVTDIGYASGFNSNRTFYRAFKQIYGMTPQEYRNT